MHKTNKNVVKLKLDENGQIEFDSNGNLSPGIYEVTIDEIEHHFSFSPQRKKLIQGLKEMLKALKDIGCEKFYLDGSFVTNILNPRDFDGCWDINAKIDWNKVRTKYPELMEFSPPRQKQKMKYGGEAFLSRNVASTSKGKHILFIDFFQKDRFNNPKGILLIKF